MSLIGRLKVYPQNDDQRAAACNMIALIVAWNQLLYPLYLHWLVGGGAWAACFTFLSTPFFVAVPFVARRDPLAGRALLPLAGIGNMLVSNWALGAASGVWLFLIPCLIITVLAFRRSEGRAMFLVMGTAILSLILMRTLHAAPLDLSSAAYERMLHLNAYSVAILTAVVGWNFRKAISD